MDKSILNDIYAFWFGTCRADRLDAALIHTWMEQSDETDCTIRERFGALLPAAAAIEWDLADLSREEGVALVVLFDQFPRNLYRTSHEAYAYDALARDLARQLIAAGQHRFGLMEQVLLGLPFVHHEDLDDQTYALKISCEIALALGPGQTESHRLVDQAVRHRELIRRFGRFPHRNAVLGRESTPEETAFLAMHGRGF